MDLTRLNTAAALTHAEGLVRRRREVDVEELELLLHWSALHSADPQAEAKARGEPIPPFSDRLVTVGGEGTPQVQEFCVAELAACRELSTAACRNQLADALDLAHRLPRLLNAVRALKVERWVAGKIARMTRQLTRDQARSVDTDISEAATTLSTGRLLDLVEARVLEADQEEAARRRDQELRRRHVSLGRDSEHGLRLLVARIKAGDAAWIDGMVDRVADLLAARLPEGTTRDVLRAEALGWLARPAELLALLSEAGDPEELMQCRATAVSPELVEAVRATDPSKLRSPAVLYVHLHQAAVEGAGTGLARVEGVGPVLTDQLRALLGEAAVTVVPVVDLHDRVSVDAYEFPERIKERVRLTTHGHYFPYGECRSRTMDIDHVRPFDPSGPPGQTGTHNAGPLTRAHHRVKTHHLGWKVRQLGPGSYAWRTPHHRYFLVDHRGTRRVPEKIGALLVGDGSLRSKLARYLLTAPRSPGQHPLASSA